jgi:hypothetical protein
MPFDDVPAFLCQLRDMEGVAPRALEFLILTAGRTGEVLGATWDEIDFESGIWVVPAKRMKAGREHRVPLSDRALAILAELGACTVASTAMRRSTASIAMLERGLSRLRPGKTYSPVLTRPGTTIVFSLGCLRNAFGTLTSRLSILRAAAWPRDRRRASVRTSSSSSRS